MSYFELLNDVSNRAEKIAKDLHRDRKVRAIRNTRFGMLWTMALPRALINSVM